MQFIAYGCHGLVYDRVSPQERSQVLRNGVFGFQYFKRFIKVLFYLLFVAFFGVGIDRPSNNIFHESCDIFPVFIKKVEIKGNFDTRFAKQFIKRNKDNTILD